MEARRLLSQGGNGYRGSAYGLLKGLRGLTVEQGVTFLLVYALNSNHYSEVRKYHKKYYVPGNLCLLVSGKIGGGTEYLLSAIEHEIGPNLTKKCHDDGRYLRRQAGVLVNASSYQKHFENCATTVFFPDRHELVGHIVMTFQGPARSDHLSRKVNSSTYGSKLEFIKLILQALDILSTYLSLTIGPQFIEMNDPVWYVFSMTIFSPLRLSIASVIRLVSNN